MVHRTKPNQRMVIEAKFVTLQIRESTFLGIGITFDVPSCEASEAVFFTSLIYILSRMQTFLFRIFCFRTSLSAPTLAVRLKLHIFSG